VEIRKSDYSIKSKILLFLIAAPVLTLSLFLLWSLETYKEDKIAYIFDTAGSIAGSRSSQLETNLKLVKDQASLLADRLTSSSPLKSETNSLFQRFDAIEFISVFKNDRPLNYLERDSKKGQTNFLKDEKLQEWLSSLEKTSDLIVHDEAKDLLYFGFKRATFKVILTVDSKKVLKSILKPGPYVIGLINKTKNIMLVTEGLETSDKLRVPFDYESSVITKVVKNDKNEEYLIAYSPLSELPFTLAAAIKKSEALGVLKSIVQRSILIFAILICASIIIGIFLTEQIADSLVDILKATQKIADGLFNVKIKVRRQDEIGAIAKSINIMAVEIKHLLKQTEDKVRMEHELNLAQILQTNFFPKDVCQYEKCKVVGKYEPASECSGDWWYHLKRDDKVFLFIGDATGHGVSAAFLTGTVFTAFKLILENTISIDKMLSKLNEVIFQVYRGKSMMTFLLAEFNPKDGKLKYVNASHDPALVLPKSETKLARNKLEFLNDKTGPRLGQQEISEYFCSEICLKPGDRVFFYTDGIFEVKNKDKVDFSERLFHQALVESHFVNSDLVGFNEQFYSQIKQFQAQAATDDITFFVLEVEG
jgi:sigma-B regulation protein RsbU (phosphoserine phosphatase)